MNNYEYLGMNVEIPTKLNGRFKVFNLDPKLADHLEDQLEKRAAVLDSEKQSGFLEDFLLKNGIDEITKINNVCLQIGVGIYEDNGPSSVSRIVAGNIVSPIPSNFNTNQIIQQPLSGLTFPRMGSWEKSNIPNGFRWTFAFRRPSVSFGGATITEMGVQVSSGNTLALLNRVWSPNNGLPHNFSNSQDTLCIVEIDKVYS